MENRRIEIMRPSREVDCYIVRSDGVSDCRITNELNGESSITFSFNGQSEKFRAACDPANLICADGRIYSTIMDKAIAAKRSDNNQRTYTITALEIYNLLGKRYANISNDPSLPAPNGNAVVILSGGSDLSGGRYKVGSAAHALNALLNGTGWTLDLCDIDGSYDLETSDKSILENVQAVVGLWGGILVWDSVKMTLSLRNEDKYQEYDGFCIRYGKNMKNLSCIQSSDLVTRLYPYGENHLSIKGINGGKEYIEDFSYTGQILEGTITNSDIYEEQTLLDWSKSRMLKLCRPHKVYSGSAVDLSKVSNFKDAPLVLGHLADIHDVEITGDKPDRQRIIKLSYDFYRPWDVEIEIGERTENFIEKFVDLLYISKKADDTIDNNGQINGGNLKPGTLPELNELRNTTEAWSITVEERMTGLSTTISQTASELRLEAKDLKNNLEGTVSLTASTLRTEMKNLDTGLRSEISITAKEIRSEVSDNVSGLRSSISQNAREISAQAKQIILKADKVDIKGMVTFTDLKTAGSTVINGSNVTTGSISAKIINGLDAEIKGVLSADQVTIRALSVRSLFVDGLGARWKKFSSLTKSDKVLAYT